MDWLTFTILVFHKRKKEKDNFVSHFSILPQSDFERWKTSSQTNSIFDSYADENLVNEYKRSCQPLNFCSIEAAIKNLSSSHFSSSYLTVYTTSVQLAARHLLMWIEHLEARPYNNVEAFQMTDSMYSTNYVSRKANSLLAHSAHKNIQ